MLIDVMVIERLEHRFGDFFQFFKIDANADSVNLVGFDLNTNLPGVTMQVTAMTGVTVKLMGSGKMGFNESSVHNFLRSGNNLDVC
jgi:hypothetical protein